MRRISTGVEQLLTAAAIAESVVSYAAELARVGSADTVTIPIVLGDGRIEEARLLLGPASQLTIVPGGVDEVTLPGSEAVLRDLQGRIARLRPAPVRAEDTDERVESHFLDFDDYR